MDIDKEQILIDSLVLLDPYSEWAAPDMILVEYSYRGTALSIYTNHRSVIDMVKDVDHVTREEADMIMICYPEILLHMCQMITAEMGPMPSTWAEKEREVD